MSDIKLLSCPFCGSKAEIVRNFGRDGVSCSQCGANFRSELICREVGPESTIIAWNTRIDRWIPVSEGLPEKSKIVLVCCIDQIVSTGYFDGEWEIFGKRLSRRHPSVDVAYWKPITLPGE